MAAASGPERAAQPLSPGLSSYGAEVPGGELDLDCRAPLPEDHLALVSALSQLSLQLRITVVLRHVGDHGAAQIASELCVAERTDWTRMARDRATMAGHLSSHEEAAHV